MENVATADEPTDIARKLVICAKELKKETGKANIPVSLITCSVSILPEDKKIKLAKHILTCCEEKKSFDDLISGALEIIG